MEVAQAPSHTRLCCVWRAARGRGTFFPGLCYPFAAHSVISAKNNLKRRQRRLLHAHAAALSLPALPAGHCQSTALVCLGHNQSLPEREETQEFLKRVGKLRAGAVDCWSGSRRGHLSSCSRRSLRGTKGMVWARLALVWCFVAAFVAPAQLPSKDSWCFAPALVFSTFQEQLWCTSPCRPHSSVLAWGMSADPCAG